jgi:anti-sigma factor ChrR (cupin superfamily)
MKLLRSGLLVAVAVVGLAVVAQAQDSPQRKELRRVDLSGAAGMEVVSSISEFKPGEELPRHLHHGVEAGYVVQGAMVQNPGQARDACNRCADPQSSRCGSWWI